MKNININLKSTILSILASAVFMTSCQEYLDQEPLDSVTEALYFETPEQFENASNYFYTRLAYSSIEEGHDLSGNYTTPDYGQGLIAPVDTDNIYRDAYVHLRAPNQLIEKAVDYTGDPADIAIPVGTAYFFRAWHHFILLKRFGGVPIVTKALDVSSEELYMPRNSRYEVIHQILLDLDEAIAKLPPASGIQQGKISTEAAKAFKARILLYEATWDKYVGDATDGDGIDKGAGSAKPAGYLSVEEMLTEAKTLAGQVMGSSAFELWDQRTALGDDTYSIYLT